MFKKFIVVIMMGMALSACGLNSKPNVYNERYTIEKVNECVDKITDLKTLEVQFKAKDGDVTKWYPMDTTFEEASKEWKHNDNVTTWDDATTTWDDI